MPLRWQTALLWAGFILLLRLLPAQGAVRLYNEAQQHYLQNEFPLAEEKIRLALKIQKTYPDAWYLWGQCRWQQKDYKGAIRYYDKALKLTPSNPEYLYHKAVALEDWGKVAKAVRFYGRTTKVSPNYLHAWKRLGNIFYTAGDYPMAIEHFSRAVDLDPLDKENFMLRANAQAQLGNHPEAIADYTYVLLHDPEDADAYFNIARERFSMGDVYGAMKDYSMVLDRRPQDKEARLNRAITLIALNLPPQALADLDTAIAIDSSFADAWRNKAYLLNEADSLTEARHAAEKAAALSPWDPDAWLLLGRIEFRQRNYQAAVDAYTRSLDLDRRSAEAYLNRGEALRVLGDETAACKDWKKVLRYDSGELARKAAQWHAIVCE